jgi:AcrR family transcriptional regulator
MTGRSKAEKRLKNYQRRNIIYVAASEVAREMGLANMTYDLVAERCAVHTSTRTISRHFPCKEDLWRLLATSRPDEFGDEYRQLVRNEA